LAKLDKEVAKKLRDYRLGPQEAVKSQIQERCSMYNYFTSKG